MKFRDAGPPLTDADLNRFEAEHGFKLPPKYREFLLFTNGGVPEFEYFEMKGNPNDTGDAVGFFDRMNVPDGGIDLAWAIREIPLYFKAGYFCIASSCFGSFICLDLNSPSREEVIYIDIADELDENGLKPTYLLAPDIWAFIAMLQREPPKNCGSPK